ncbi:MAG TPA: two-component regulator propeller domain-containing protein [Nitrospiria bacterium]|nr:two-component regulator propeller domain-containing protein [Nitrospiria bacterium]
MTARIVPESKGEGISSNTLPAWTSWSIGEVVIRALAVEKNTLWIGTSNGLIEFNKKTENHRVYNTRDGLVSNVIVSITVDRHGNKWFGTYGGGLTRYDGRTWEEFTPYGRGSKEYGARWVQYDPSRGLGDLWVYNVLFDRHGTMWAATWKGASRFDGKEFVTYTMDDGLVDKWVYTIAQDKDGVLWFGTEGGINSFDGKRFRGWTHKDGLGAEPPEESDESGQEDSGYGPPSHHHQQAAKENRKSNPNYVISSVIDKLGIKWFGTWGGGLSRFDGKRFRNYTTKDGLAGNVVNALALDRKGNLWVGTNNGVSRFDGKRFTNLTMRDGLFGNYVYSIAIDADGSKWFGTYGGVSHYTGE